MKTFLLKIHEVAQNYIKLQNATQSCMKHLKSLKSPSPQNSAIAPNLELADLRLAIWENQPWPRRSSVKNIINIL
jgi:hypothetical protein